MGNYGIFLIMGNAGYIYIYIYVCIYIYIYDIYIYISTTVFCRVWGCRYAQED